MKKSHVYLSSAAAVIVAGLAAGIYANNDFIPAKIASGIGKQIDSQLSANPALTISRGNVTVEPTGILTYRVTIPEITGTAKFHSDVQQDISIKSNTTCDNVIINLAAATEDSNEQDNLSNCHLTAISSDLPGQLAVTFGAAFSLDKNRNAISTLEDIQISDIGMNRDGKQADIQGDINMGGSSLIAVSAADASKIDTMSLSLGASNLSTKGIVISPDDAASLKSVSAAASINADSLQSNAAALELQVNGQGSSSGTKGSGHFALALLNFPAQSLSEIFKTKAPQAEKNLTTTFHMAQETFSFVPDNRIQFLESLLNGEPKHITLVSQSPQKVAVNISAQAVKGAAPNDTILTLSADAGSISNAIEKAGTSLSLHADADAGPGMPAIDIESKHKMVDGIPTGQGKVEIDNTTREALSLFVGSLPPQVQGVAAMFVNLAQPTADQKGLVVNYGISKQGTVRLNALQLPGILGQP